MAWLLPRAANPEVKTKAGAKVSELKAELGEQLDLNPRRFTKNRKAQGMLGGRQVNK